MSYFKHFFQNTMTLFHNLGYKLEYLESLLNEFDLFCDEYYPNVRELTKEISQKWIYSTKIQSKHVLSERVSTIKYLSKYLNSIGIESYMPDYGIDLGPHKCIHLFDDHQLMRFFDGTDHINQHKRSPNREYIAPVIFRLIYSCGLRNSEACQIKMSDIDLEKGIINIYHSKGDKDRRIFMDDSMRKLCLKFNEVYSKILPNREYFFQPSYEKKKLTKYNIDDFFDIILKITGLDKELPIKPTVHGLRHLFAVKSMKKCLASGEDFNNWIKYLSQYMGHQTTNETLYYLHMTESLLPEYREKMKNLTEGMRTVYEEE